MSLEQDWVITSENKLYAVRDDYTPLFGPSSLRFFSSALQYTTMGMRKSASIYNSNAEERGTMFGRIRTLIQRRSPNQAQGWSGIYFLASGLGIGTFAEPTQTMYQVTDKGGQLRLLKFTIGLPTVMQIYSENLLVDTTYALSVSWDYNPNENILTISTALGTATDFSDLTAEVVVEDDDPHTVALSEGLFAETVTHNHACHYVYDNTRLSDVTIL